MILPLSLEVQAVICIMISEAFLNYVNILARIKYKEYFTETGDLWLKFDKAGKTYLSLFLREIFILSIVYVFLVLGFTHGLYLILGMVTTNAVIDWRTFYLRYFCIKNKCLYLDDVKRCVNCKSHMIHRYSISPFTLKIKRKKGSLKGVNVGA